MNSSRTQESNRTIQSVSMRVLVPLLSRLLLVTVGAAVIPAAHSQKQEAMKIETFRVGPYPQAMAFDGANIWVTSGNSTSVTKLRASDGANLGSFDVGSITVGATFDGTYVWLADWGYAANTVTKVRPDDGSVQGVYSIGNYGPYAVIFDGENIWVSTLESTVVKMRPSDGAVLGTYPTNSGETPGFHLTYDGENIWVTNADLNTVSKLRASDGALLGTFPVGDYPVGIAFDGANIWIANLGDNTLSKLRASDGAVLGRAVT